MNTDLTSKKFGASIARGALMALLAVLVCPDARSQEAAPLHTRWAASVSPTNLLAEYPRPQFVRAQWQNLNGLWDYAISTDSQHAPQTYAGKILVPFPIESHLSGVGNGSMSAARSGIGDGSLFRVGGRGSGCNCISGPWTGRRRSGSMAGWWVRIVAVTIPSAWNSRPT